MNQTITHQPLIHALRALWVEHLDRHLGALSRGLVRHGAAENFSEASFSQQVLAAEGVGGGLQLLQLELAEAGGIWPESG